MNKIQKWFILVLLVFLSTSLFAQQADFYTPPKYIGPPLPLHAETNRAFQGIPSMAVTPGGRLWVTWYAGPTPGEDHNNYVILYTSGDNGATWQTVLVVDPDQTGPVRAFDPQIWMAPDGKLRLAWAQSESVGHNRPIGHARSIAGVWFLATSEPESENASRMPVF